MRLLLHLGGIALAAYSIPLAFSDVGPPADGVPAGDVFVRDVKPLLEASCVECHGGPNAAGARARGELDLTQYSSTEIALGNPELWALVSEVLALDEMPPPGQPRPDPGLVAAASPWLHAIASQAAPAPEPARLRRLNGREFAATVRDLYGVDLPREEIFGDDPVGHGYDTSAGVQTWNEDVLKSYLTAAEYVAARVFPADRGLRSLGLFEGQAIGGRRGGLRRLNSNGTARLSIDVPVTGRWRLRVGAYGEQAGPDPVRVELLAGQTKSPVMDLTEGPEQPAILEFEAELAAGQRFIGVNFLNDWYQPELKPSKPHDRNLVIQWFDLLGPLDAPEPSRLQQELVNRHGGDQPNQASMLAELAASAWRRPVSAAEMEAYTKLSVDGDLAQALQLGLTAILTSPHFTFLLEERPKLGAAQAWLPLDDLALASRLSYFLWSSCPDVALIELAKAGQLHDQQVLVQQAERMLLDERASALATGFMTQWLGLSGLRQHKPDRIRFPQFTPALADSMLSETQALFLDVLRNDVRVRSLLLADWTYVDEPLARHYAIEIPDEGLDSRGFARVALTGTSRRGLLGHASVLTVTSDPARTSPVLRGKWILEKVTGTPPPPPPPGVGSLPEEGPAASGTLRERLEAHRAEASCAVCHAGMDPLGFGLEGFDAVGSERQSGTPVDNTGELPDGRQFTGLLELVELLAGEPGFEQHLASELLVYALGRPLKSADRQALMALWSELDSDEIGLRSLIVALVQSKPFTHLAPQQG